MGDTIMIPKFEGEYSCFSNFYPRSVLYNGKRYKTKEHAFQCQKATNQKDFDFIFNAVTPYQAKKRSRTIKIKGNWKESRRWIMHDIVLAFFTEWSDLRKILLDSGDQELIEGNEYHDKYWGVCDGVGENWLGKILMLTRDELKGV
jgi:ribA/ribD-fused uncharacterized protein